MSEDRSDDPMLSRQIARPLDETNLRILEVLRENGRISIAALAARVQISRANAYTRVEAMVADGTIQGFSALVDPKKVGLDICALVFVTVHPQSWMRFREAVTKLPDVEYCSITTGEHDAMMLIRAVDVGAVHDFVVGAVSARPEVKSVVSVVVLDEVVKRAYLLPTDIPDRSTTTGPLGMTRFVRAAEGRDDLSRTI